MWKEPQLHLPGKLRYNHQIKLLQYPFLSTTSEGIKIIKIKVLFSAYDKDKENRLPAEEQ